MASTPSADSQNTADRRLPKIVLVDDDPQLCDSLKLRLQRLGLRVDCASTGMAGFWLAVETQPDVIICDLVMPDGEGGYLLSRFRSHSVTRNVPVIILTGQKNPALKRQMLSVGATAYLVKPLVFDDLVRELTPLVPLAGALSGLAREPANRREQPR